MLQIQDYSKLASRDTEGFGGHQHPRRLPDIGWCCLLSALCQRSWRCHGAHHVVTGCNKSSKILKTSKNISKHIPTYLVVLWCIWGGSTSTLFWFILSSTNYVAPCCAMLRVAHKIKGHSTCAWPTCEEAPGSNMIQSYRISPSEHMQNIAKLCKTARNTSSHVCAMKLQPRISLRRLTLIASRHVTACSCSGATITAQQGLSASRLWGWQSTRSCMHTFLWGTACSRQSRKWTSKQPSVRQRAD